MGRSGVWGITSRRGVTGYSAGIGRKAFSIDNTTRERRKRWLEWSGVTSDWRGAFDFDSLDYCI
jgi:hypothetical protein